MNLLLALLFCLGASATPFSRILVLGEVELQGFEWTDLGLEREGQFLSPLQKSWEKWLQENLPKSVGGAVVCEEECRVKYRHWQETPSETLLAEADPELRHILWLKVNLLIRRRLQDGIQIFSWDGRVHLIDGNSKKGVLALELPREEKEWVNAPQTEINTALVSRVYRTPLGAFPQVVRKIEEIRPLNRVLNLVITGHHSLGDVMKLGELLKARGSSLGLQTELGQFGSTSATMKVYVQGEEKSFTDFLSQLKELKSSYNYAIVSEPGPQGIMVRLVKP